MHAAIDSCTHIWTTYHAITVMIVHITLIFSADQSGAHFTSLHQLHVPTYTFECHDILFSYHVAFFRKFVVPITSHWVVIRYLASCKLDQFSVVFIFFSHFKSFEQLIYLLSLLSRNGTYMEGKLASSTFLVVYLY